MDSLIDKSLIINALGFDDDEDMGTEALLEKIRHFRNASSASTSIANEGAQNLNLNATPPREETESTTLSKCLQEFKVDLPIFDGDTSKTCVYSFLEGLRDFQHDRNLTEEQLLTHVLQKCCKSRAADWLRFKGKFSSFDEFRRSLLQEFVSFSYAAELRQLLSEVYQGRDEPFSQYVIRVSNLYSRLEEVVDVQEQIRFAIERCHPSFKKFLFGEKFTSLQHLADRGLAIQQHLLSDLYYHGSQAKKDKVENPLAILQQSAEASNSNWLLPRALNSGLVSRSADNNKVSDGVRKGKGGKNKVVCYRCGRVGHYATQCTSTSNRNRESNAVNGRKNRKIIRRNESEDFSPLIDVNIRGLKRQCFADSGSSVNLLQEGLAKVLMKRGVKFIQRDVELCLARGTAVASGSMRVNIFVHGKRVPTLFYVLPGLQHEVLIGREFLADAGLCLNLADKS